jgi:uncharacterized protein YndB with AHSA1/START domain
MPEVSKSILINAPIAKVWDVITGADTISKWMLEENMSVISDWKVGSPIVFKRALTNITFEDKGTVLKSEKERIFQYNHWSKLTRLKDAPENYSIITLSLEPKGNETLLSVIHSNLIAEAGLEHANFYWNSTLRIIKKMAEN